jgi:predicted glycogen debranching enzyme
MPQKRWSVHFGPEVCRDLPLASSKEWLETNGLGGYAMGTVSGLPTRRYHGLLVASLDPPIRRCLFLSTLHECVETPEGSFPLGCMRYPGTVHPDGYRNLSSFHLRPCPTWEYRAPGLGIRKLVALVPGEDTVLVAYMLLPGSRAARLTIRPLLAFRDHHALTHTNVAADLRADAGEGFVRFSPYPALPALTLAHTAGKWSGQAWWNYRVQYGFEEKRGLDYEEDLMSPGEIALALSPGDVVSLAASLRPVTPAEAESLWERELERRTAPIDSPDGSSPLVTALWDAADQFVAGTGAGASTLSAGYPWFTPRGRDAMIALPGLLLARGRMHEARRVLETEAASLESGMLPNGVSDRTGAPEYSAADASLWFILAIRAYLVASRDLPFVQKSLLPKIVSVIRSYAAGAHPDIRVDADGLLVTGSPDEQLTWMNAKVGEWVVTPRQGKAVEINALWINALRTLEAIAKRTDHADLAARAGQAARRATGAFRRVFWDGALGRLADVVDGTHVDASMRPNQLLAIALPYRMLDADRERAVLASVRSALLTPLGLRSLAPDDPRYRSRYAGDVRARDSAYHQGTVWPWLLGPFVDASLRLRGDTPEVRDELRDLFSAFEPHLAEVGLGTISEVFDGEAPQRPGGCVSQAASVAEVLRASLKLEPPARPSAAL